MSIAAAALLLAPIIVEVGNVRNDHGRVRVSICPRARFLADSCPYAGSAPAHAGTTVVTVENVPPGDYAVSAFLDENSNDAVDRALFGIPKEGVGFSRDAPIRWSPPRWDDAVFAHGVVPQTISFGLRYFLGPGSPAQWRAAHPR